MKEIDINCDMGESIGQLIIGNDDAIFPYITSCNIACGFHGGDDVHMKRTVLSALAHGVRLGAHPSYPDLEGFGRREMQLQPAKLKSIVKQQVSTLKALSESLGGKLAYVKPHGALYNTVARDHEEAKIVYKAIQEVDPTLSVMGLAGCSTTNIADEFGLRFIDEAFADRVYEPNGSLTSRSKEGAVITDPDKAVEQVLSIILDQKIVSSIGSILPIYASSICIHGDNPAAVEILRALDEAFIKNHIIKRNEIS